MHFTSTATDSSRWIASSGVAVFFVLYFCAEKYVRREDVVDGGFSEGITRRIRQQRHWLAHCGGAVVFVLKLGHQRVRGAPLGRALRVAFHQCAQHRNCHELLSRESRRRNKRRISKAAFWLLFLLVVFCFVLFLCNMFVLFCLFLFLFFCLFFLNPWDSVLCVNLPSAYRAHDGKHHIGASGPFRYEIGVVCARQISTQHAQLRDVKRQAHIVSAWCLCEHVRWKIRYSYKVLTFQAQKQEPQAKSHCCKLQAGTDRCLNWWSQLWKSKSIVSAI